MKQNKFTEALSGIGLGILVGTIIGLSVSQVVGIVLGALTSLLAAFFGLTSIKDDTQGGKLNVRPVTITTFAFSAFTFILIGIYIRTHNSLSPSINEQKNELIEMGIKPEAASKILLKLRYNIEFDEKGMISNDGPDNKPHPSSSSLYSVQIEQADSVLADPNFSYDHIANIFKSEQGKLTQFYNTVNLYIKDTTQKKDILKSTLELIKQK